MQPALNLGLEDRPKDASIRAARDIACLLDEGASIDAKQLRQLFTDHCGGDSDADGRWSMRDAYAASELACVFHLLGQPDRFAFDGLDEMDALASLQRRFPLQSLRNEEQIALQQFSTPLPLAFIAARAAQIRPTDLVLEPSAGTGLLAVWAKRASASLVLNEIAPVRRLALSAAFPDDRVTAHDGALIDDLLDTALIPDAVLMNPPFSQSLERGKDSHAGARHLVSAFKRLKQGGRLVAILPEWFDLGALRSRNLGPYSVRLNASIDAAFVRHGTSVSTRLIVIDKGTDEPGAEAIKASDLAELAHLVADLPIRTAIKDPSRPLLPARCTMPAVRLVTSRPRLPATRGPEHADTAAETLKFLVLDEPAPLAEQVGIYLPYRPSRVRFEAAVEHPTPLVESVAMGSIAAPRPDAAPHLPAHVMTNGLLSDAQLETLLYAASAFERDLPGRFLPVDNGCSLQPSEDGQTFVQGYYLGDGTGAGKGRQVAAIFLDRWLQGKRRHIWLSKNETLLEDARRDWSALGGIPLDIQPLSQWKLGEPVTMTDGILFVTYPTLRSGRADVTRLDQILAWAGENFDGVIAFDEAHAMANAAGGEGARGRVQGSEQGVAGLRLQNLLPRARVLYVSATGASDVNNLAYATRLGLWGPGTAFANREEFVSGIRAGGIAAMELVARDLKALGLYTSRALSFAGVEYEVLDHALTEAQIKVYDAYAEAWAIIHSNLGAALEETRIVDGETGDTLNRNAKSSVLSQFEGTKQRFFAQLLLSMKLPSLLPAIAADIDRGDAVVVQLVSTAEAMLDRRLAELEPHEREALEIDLSPREYVVDYLMKSFPVRLMRVFTDENGTPRSEPMSDENGNPVFCRSAIAARDAMVEQLCALPPVATALDAIIERFGVDGVAEVTGRTKRLIIGRDGTQKLQSRTPRTNLAETTAFMTGTKRILVFSDAGGTGRSYHADIDAPNHARRIHYLLEPGWRADAAIQGLGRTHRTRQASAPLFRPVTTDVKGERRFISTIARRLDSLGALTRGQRQTGGQNLFNPADNLESSYAKEALTRWFHLLFNGKLEAVGLETFQQLSGLKIALQDGSMAEELPPIQRWLNRILAFPIALQNAIFDEYLSLVEARVEAARAAGTLDIGVETVPVDDLRIIKDRVLRTDTQTGATTHLLDLEIARSQRPLSFERLNELYGPFDRAHVPVFNARSEKVALAIPARSILTEEGDRIARLELVRPLRRDKIATAQFEESHWATIDAARFADLWRAEEADALASPKVERIALATGLLLPVWDKFPGQFVRVARIVTGDGRSLIGREVPAEDVPDLAKALGLEFEHILTPVDLAETVLRSGKTLPISADLQLKRSLVNGSQRLEVIGFEPARLPELKAAGCFTEIIRYQTRLFVPVTDAPAVLARISGQSHAG